MIRKLVRQMLTAQILSALTVSLCLLIDNIMIGRFLGERALTAYGLASPTLLVAGAAGSMLSAGVQVACGKSLGRGDREETNVGYSSAVAAALIAALVVTLPVVLFRIPLARSLGATEALLLRDTGRYMAGFGIGMPATVFALVLVPFLQMAGKNGLLIASVAGMTVADVAFDYLNVLVFRGGMFGMGLASALSYYIAILISIGYFLSKKCVFTFSLKRIQRRKIRELFIGGIPTVLSMMSSVALVFAVNHILLVVGRAPAVAAYSVISTVMNAANCITAGAGGVALTLSGIFAGEEDRSALCELLRELVRASVVLGLAVTVLLAVFARPCAELFIPNAGVSRAMTVRGLRFFSLGMTFCCLNGALKNLYQGTGRVRMMELISVLDNAVLPMLAAFLFSRAVGVGGVWFYFLTCETLTTLGIFGYVWLKKRRGALRAEDVLLLRKDFSVPPEDLLEVSPADIEGVMAFSREADAFCRSRGGSERTAVHLALCIEEMGGNIVTHGFSASGREHGHLAIRLFIKDGRWTLRFRDNCVGFDPIRHVSEGHPTDGMGIRLAMRMADEARYTYSMGLNNLTLVLRDPA